MPVQFSYMVQQPDGSVSTLQSEAERAPTWGELADHVTSTGAQLLPATPAAQPAAAPAAPSLAERAVNVVVPQRSFTSQLPSGGAAVLGGELGAGLGLVAAPFAGPLAPAVIPLASAGTAGLFSGATEAGQIGLERALGWPAAEPGTFGQRVGNAALRGAIFEALPIAARLAPRVALGTTLGPVLNLFGRAAAPAVAAPEEFLPMLPAYTATALRSASQALGATPIWPSATTAFGPPPPGYAAPGATSVVPSAPSAFGPPPLGYGAPG